MKETTIVKGIGAFIVLEALISVMASQDQRPVSHLGRIIRLGAGFVLCNVR